MACFINTERSGEREWYVFAHMSCQRQVNYFNMCAYATGFILLCLFLAIDFHTLLQHTPTETHTHQQRKIWIHKILAQWLGIFHALLWALHSVSFSLKTMLVCWVPSAEFFQIFAQYLSELINNMSEGLVGWGIKSRTKDAGVGECCLSIFRLVYLKALCIIFQTNRPRKKCAKFN